MTPNPTSYYCPGCCKVRPRPAPIVLPDLHLCSDECRKTWENRNGKLLRRECRKARAA